MAALKEFQIAYVGLSLGKHEFSYKINEKFFSCFDESEVKSGNVKCALLLEKKSDMLILDFSIKGYVDLECDLCLDDFPQDIIIDSKLIFKFGEFYLEQSDEIIVIPTTQAEINVAQYIYEFIHLALPAKRVHPGGLGDRMNCDKEVIKRLENLSHSKSNKKKKTQTDSRWEELKKLKFD